MKSTVGGGGFGGRMNTGGNSTAQHQLNQVTEESREFDEGAGGDGGYEGFDGQTGSTVNGKVIVQDPLQGNLIMTNQEYNDVYCRDPLNY